MKKSCDRVIGRDEALGNRLSATNRSLVEISWNSEKYGEFSVFDAEILEFCRKSANLSNLSKEQ